MSRLRRLVLLVLSLSIGLVLAEFIVRLIPGTAPEDMGSPINLGDFSKSCFQMDNELGFIPRLGEDSEYGLYGCLHNNYDPTKKEGRERILFVGDSVTHRGRIIKALRSRYGEEKYEYWNAGVESYNIEQELSYYERHNFELAPDRIVLTFHNNDFQSTPISFRSNGEVQIISFRHSERLRSRSLYKHSALYRLWLRFWITNKNQESVANVKQALSRFKTLTSEQNIEFAVVVFPILKPPNEWSDSELRSRQSTLQILEQLDIPYYDLLPSLEAALEDGIETQETPNDPWHPNDQVSERFADYLKKGKLIP
jgi:lysophospholipase L1-like esterase